MGFSSCSPWAYYSTACGIFLDQELNLCPLCWQIHSQPLDYQGSPIVFYFFFFNSNTFLPILVKAKSLIHVRLFATPWTVDYEVPPSMRFSRQEYWSGLPFPSPLAHIRHLVNICLFGPPDLTMKQRTESSIQNMMTKRESNVSPKLEGHGENT